MHLKTGLTLRAARKEAKAILGAVAKGGDPLGERRKVERAESDTLKAVVEEILPARAAGCAPSTSGAPRFNATCCRS